MNETIASALSNEEVKDILTRFVQTNTVNPPGNEKVLAQWIADDFKKTGIEAEVRDMGDGRANVVARIKGSGERKALLFDGHLDTVPPGNWTEDPWGGCRQRRQTLWLGGIGHERRSGCDDACR